MAMKTYISPDDVATKPEVFKPAKRIKALHRSSGTRLSLREFARQMESSCNDSGAKEWLEGKARKC